MTTTDLGNRALHVAGVIVRQLRSKAGPAGTQPAGGHQSASGWLAVTVLCEPADLDGDSMPAPLAELADDIEVRIRPAPGDKGTELAARLRDQASGDGATRRLTGNDAESDLRSALRRAKQLLEVGEVLAVDPAPHGERKAAPGGALLESWTQAAPGAGVR